VDKQEEAIRPHGDGMADDNEVLGRLDRYAKAVARNILLKFNLAHDVHRAEDIAQNLLIAGSLVWREKRDEGLARHRISTRAVNETKKLAVELRQPQPLARQADSGDDGREEKPPDVTDGQGGGWISDCPAPRSSPLEDMIVREYLDGLPERQRRIAECRMADMQVKEIAQVLGVSPSTVERELVAMQKGYRHEQGN